MNRPFQYSTYANIREIVNTGDLVFFAGNGFVSRLIRFATNSPYSHVAVVMRTDGDRIVLMESTLLRAGLRGCQPSYLSDRIKDYQGRADIAFLSHDARSCFNGVEAEAFLLKCQGKPYDPYGAWGAWVGQMFRIPGKERLDSLFCSELADAAHRAGGLCIGDDRTPTPEELARRPIISGFFRVKDSIT